MFSLGLRLTQTLLCYSRSCQKPGKVRELYLTWKSQRHFLRTSPQTGILRYKFNFTDDRLLEFVWQTRESQEIRIRLTASNCLFSNANFEVWKTNPIILNIG